MQEIIDQLLHYYRLILRRHLLVIAVAVPVCILGWAVLSLLPDVYRAETRLAVDSRSFLIDLLQGLAVEDRGSQPELIEVARTTLTARRNLQRIANDVGTDLNLLSQADQDKYLQKLASHINVQQEGRPPINQLVIQFEHPDPQVALAAVQSMLKILVDTSMGRSQEETARSQAFIEEQIEEFEARLIEAERRLSDFKTQNVGLMPGEGQTYFTQLQRVREEVQDIRLELREAVQRRDQLRLRIDEIRAGGSAASLNAERILALQQQLDELRLRFTDNHPDVISTREQLASLMEADGPAPSARISGDRVATEFMVELSRAEATAASIGARLEEFERRKTELEAAITTIPAVEAELAKLTRDYESNQQRYQELLQRREAARLSREATATVEETQFRILDEPRLYGAPVRPRRSVLGAAVLLLAWGAGAGVAVLLAELRPSFQSSQQLSQVTGVTVLGTVSRIDHQGELITYPLWPLLVAGALSVLAFLLVVMLNRGLLF